MKSGDRYRALPVQAIPVDDGLILKRGPVEVRIGGGDAASTVRTVLDIASDRGATADEILSAFDPADHPTIENLIARLLERRLLVLCRPDEPPSRSAESPLDLFQWQFDRTGEEMERDLRTTRMIVIGVNMLSRRLVSTLQDTGISSLTVIDDPALRNLSCFDESGRMSSEAGPLARESTQPVPEDFAEHDPDCVIATCDFGFSPALRHWNSVCIQSKRVFYPVLLHNMVGHIGPLVVPQETPCFECFLSRRDSHLEQPELHRAVDAHSFQGQHVAGFHPSMASIVAEIAAFELVKSFSPGLPSHSGSQIEVALLAPRLAVRKVLKVPRCLVCSPLNTRPAITLNRDMFTLEDRGTS